MSEQGWSWVRALESGTLSEKQLGALQAMVDEGDAESLWDAARVMDYDDRLRREDE